MAICIVIFQETLEIYFFLSFFSLEWGGGMKISGDQVGRESDEMVEFQVSGVRWGFGRGENPLFGIF